VTSNTIKQANNTPTNKNKRKQTKRTKQNKKHGKTFLHLPVVRRRQQSMTGKRKRYR
jgi:hypothetical protein